MKAHPSDTLWQPQSIIWVVLAAEGLAIVLALAPDASVGRWVYFGIASLVLQWIALLTLGMLSLGRKSLDSLPPQRIAWYAVLAMLVAFHALGAVLWLALPELREVPTQRLLTLWLQSLGILLVVGLFSAIAFQNHWRSRQLALQLKQAELDKLRARVNPHFLFNTLNTAIALVHRYPEQVEQLLFDLSDLFRAALSSEGMNSLEGELQLARRYLEIESLRHGERLQVVWNIETPVPDGQLPTLAFQALVENAVRHGVEPSDGATLVTIDLATSANTLSLRVTNPAPRPGSQSGVGHSIGIASTRARIEDMTNGEGSLQTRVADGLFIAEITLPR